MLGSRKARRSKSKSRKARRRAFIQSRAAPGTFKHNDRDSATAPRIDTAKAGRRRRMQKASRKANRG